MANQNADQIAHAFVQHYYTMFDSDRSKLGSLYRSNSMLTYEDKKGLGQQKILEIFKNLKFKTVSHQVKTVDSQPSGSGGILVYVQGDLKVDGGPNPVKFGQLFQLIPTDASGSNFWVHNDIFRLNYG